MPGSRVARVYIGRIPNSCREKDLDRFFKGYGHLKDVLIKNGYGFVEFEDYRDADDAVYELNGKDLLGERVTVEHAKGVARRGPIREPSRRPVWLDRYGPPVRTPYQVIVENLSSKISWQDLKDYMRKGGEVSYADAHRHRRNEGIVEFASYSDLKRAIDKMDGADLNGRRIRIVSQYRRSSRSRSRHRRSRSRRSYSTSRSRSRSRSRSKSRSKWSRSRSHNRSRSRSKGRSHSRSKGRSMSRSRSRDRSHLKEESKRRSASTSKREQSTDRPQSAEPEERTDEDRPTARESISPRRSRSRSQYSDASSHSSKEKRSRSRSQSQEAKRPKYSDSASPDRENGYIST